MEIVLLAVAVASLIWGVALVRRGGLMFLAMASIFVGSCWGHPFLNFSIGPAPITLDRLVLAVAFGGYLYYRWRGWADPKPLAKSDLLIAALACVLMFSLLTHDFAGDRFYPAMKLMIFWLMPIVLYWVARQTRLTERGMIGAMLYFGAFAIYLGATGFAETRELWSLVYPKYIRVPGEYFGRARGPFLNPVSVGIFLSVGMAAALLRWKQFGLIGRLAAIAVCMAASVGVYCTYTRMVWFSYLFVLVMVVGLQMPWSLRIPTVAAVTLATVLLVSLNFERILSFKRDKDATADATKDSLVIRPVIMAVAWRMFQDRPLLGCGFGQYSKQCIYYVGDRSSPLQLERGRNFVQHNVLLGLLCESGLAAMLPFLALLVFWTVGAWGLWSDTSLPICTRHQGLMFLAVLIPYFLNGMCQDTALVPMANMLLFYYAGVTTGLRLAPRGANVAQVVRRPAELARRWRAATN